MTIQHLYLYVSRLERIQNFLAIYKVSRSSDSFLIDVNSYTLGNSFIMFTNTLKGYITKILFYKKPQVLYVSQWSSVIGYFLNSYFNTGLTKTFVQLLNLNLQK